MYQQLTLWDRIISADNPLRKFKVKGGYTACIYPEPYKCNSEVVRWFFSRNNHCQVFFACSKELSDQIDTQGWAEPDEDFVLFVEYTLMPFCIENTQWYKCNRYSIPYDEKIPNHLLTETDYWDKGCDGSICCCEPFGNGDFTYGIAEPSEFNF